jgi:uncharacterized protein YfdQ (DUF2303 family)
MEAVKTIETKLPLGEAQVGFDAGMKVALATQSINNLSRESAIPFILTQPGMTIATIEQTFPAPMSRRGNIVVTSVKSFIELVNRDYEEGNSVIFAMLPSGDAGNITAIIDFHNNDNSANWCEYRIILKLSYTTEWLEWRKILNTATRQLDLAEFLEERYIDVHEANGVSGATILETALSLQAKRDVQFGSDYRLQNGDTALHFTETTSARAGQKGEIEIPKEFCLFIPIYEGFDAIPVRVLFRYRIQSGVLTFILKPVNVERLLINIREAIMTHIGEQTELPVYLGDASTVPTRKLQ